MKATLGLSVLGAAAAAGYWGMSALRSPCALFGFALKRLIRIEGHSFGPDVFHAQSQKLIFNPAGYHHNVIPRIRLEVA
jgi:hypothetical protein